MAPGKAFNQTDAHLFKVPAESEWERRRRQKADANFNFSEIIQEKTIDGRLANLTPATTPIARDKPSSSKYTFEPIEMTGRSTTCVQATKGQPENAMGKNSPSVDQIVESSTRLVNNLRMSLINMKVDANDQPSFSSEEFLPSEKVKRYIEIFPKRKRQIFMFLCADAEQTAGRRTPMGERVRHFASGQYAVIEIDHVKHKSWRETIEFDRIFRFHWRIRP